MTESRRNLAIALGLVALALALRLHGLGWGLPAVYEEAYPFKKSWEMWGWGPQAHFDPNPHFFNYPTFYFYVQFLGQGLLYVLLRSFGHIHSTLDYRVLYALDKTDFYLVGRGISALFGAATVLVTFAIGRRIGGRGAAIAAALLVAINETHITKSQVIEVDVPMTLLAMLCCWFALRILESPRRRDYILAGLCGGLATSTKYNGALLALPILLAHLLTVLRPVAPPVPAPGEGRGRRATTPVSTSVAARLGRDWRDLALAAAVFVVTILLTSPYLLLDNKNFWIGFNYERLHMQIGHFGLDDTPTFIWYLRVMTDTLFGWPMALAAGVAFVYYVVVRRRPWAWVLSVFPVVYLILISKWSMKAERYILPLLPLAAIFATTFVFDMAARLGRRRAWLPAAAAAAAVVVLAVPSLIAYRADLATRLRGDTRTLSTEWIEAHVPVGSFLVTEAYGPEPIGALDMQNLDADVRQVIQKEKPDTKVYAVMAMPMYQVRAENSAIFYDTRLYDDIADAIVVSTSVASRYRKDPVKFAPQIAFYDSLERGWNKLREFGVADGSGPHITIYGNPRALQPFGRRGAAVVPPPPPVVQDLMPGAFSSYFERFAFLYEYYGYKAAAAQIYQMGLRYPDQPFDARRGLGVGALRTSLAAGRSEQMLAILDQLEARSPGTGEANYWRTLRTQLTHPASRDTTRTKSPGH